MGQEICERGRIYTLVRFSTQPCYTGIYSSQCTSFLPNPSEYYAQEHLIKISVNTWQYPKMYVKTSKIRLSMCKSISFLPKFSQCTSFLPPPPLPVNVKFIYLCFVMSAMVTPYLFTLKILNFVLFTLPLMAYLCAFFHGECKFCRICTLVVF